MFQLEVAKRICEGPGSKTYGIISVLVQAFYNAEFILSLDPLQFTPPPKVNSGVIRLTRKIKPTLNCDEILFFKIVKTSFQQRRKTLRNSLKVFNLSDNLKLKPSFMFKYTNGAPISTDLTANFLFNEKFWLGAAYRFNESAGALGALVDFQVSKQFRVGYAYEHPISDIRPYSDGTHEILLMFEVFKNKRIKSPRYF